MNVAAVHTQLGSAAAAEQDYDEACNQHTKALVIRENICDYYIDSPESDKLSVVCDGNRVDVLHALQALAQVHLLKGGEDVKVSILGPVFTNLTRNMSQFDPKHVKVARDLFQRAKAMSEMLLGSLEITPTRSEAEGVGETAESTSIENSLVRALLQSLYSLRSIARLLGCLDEATLMEKVAKSVKKKYECSSAHANASYEVTRNGSLESISSDPRSACDRNLIEILLTQRTRLRAALTTCQPKIDSGKCSSVLEKLIRSNFEKALGGLVSFEHPLIST